ncbi:di-trans,poly-cis-decaprenylcistransferase [Candidatus Dependentiae bacterium]|nr:di-trans,poly-cis-decaprenylcistransferase [Candidatus Dependentiae bacterium]
MQHLAIIPDGNRRWAKANKLESIFGHRKGLDIVKTAIKVCIEKNIKYLSFYTFSLENFNRSEIEKKYLFSMLADEFRAALPELLEQRIRVRFIGDSAYFPSIIRDTIADVERETANCDKLNLNLLFCYGSRGEVVHAAKVLAQKVKEGLLNIEEITEESFGNSLWTAGTPDPDLIVRTGNTVRVSNYLLYQGAYAEYMFLEQYWPEVTEEILGSCIEKFKNIKRNFGH